MATTINAIVTRISDRLIGLSLLPSQTPFSFDMQTAGVVDGSFRILTRAQRVIGGFRYTEERIDQVVIWVAKTFEDDPTYATSELMALIHTITSAIVRDGHEVSGEYSVPDEGRSHDLRADAGSAYAVLQLTIPVCYETAV